MYETKPHNVIPNKEITQAKQAEIQRDLVKSYEQKQIM